MSFSDLLGALIGWLGEFVTFLVSFIPRFKIVRWNERAVKYKGGGLPTKVEPGLCWYWPWKTHLVEYNVSRMVLSIPPISIETKDGIPCCVGIVVVYKIVDVLRYEVENFETEESISEVAQAALRNIVTDHDWSKLGGQATDDSRLDGVLKRRMQSELSRFGIEVEAARPADQVRISGVFRVFGLQSPQSIVSVTKET